MLIITSLAAAAVSATIGAAAATNAVTAPPPIVITVRVAADVPPTLLSRPLEEADAVWRPTGVTFLWRRLPQDAAERLDRPADGAATGLRVVVGPLRGRSPRQDLLPLGWIQFDDDSPEQEIYVSYPNALDYMEGSQGVVGLISKMPVLERELKLARAMGRALAHELGHYLLASKAHTPRGLMEASHTATEFFDYSRRAFAIDATQRQAVTARLRHDAVVVRR